MNDQLIDFVVENRTEIKEYVDEHSLPAIKVSRIFETIPDMQDEYIYNVKLRLLYKYLQDNFTDINFEDFNLTFNTTNVKIYLES